MLKPYLGKEIKEWTRTQSLLISGAVLLFSTFSTPLILYALPQLLKNEMPEILDLFQANQMISMTNFFGDAYQLFGGVLLFLAYRSFTKEFKTGAFITPQITGAKKNRVLLSKYLTIFSYMTLACLLTTIFSYFYSGLVFTDDTFSFKDSLMGLGAIVTFISLHLSILLLCVSRQLKAYITLPLIYMSYYGLSGLVSLLPLKFKTPYDLIQLNYNTLTWAHIGIYLLVALLMAGLALAWTKVEKPGVTYGRKSNHPIGSRG